MTVLPTLTMYVSEPDSNEHSRLILTPPSGNTETAVLALPFPLEKVPLLLRALNARQYVDYPFRDRLFRTNESKSIQEEMLADLRRLQLLDGNDIVAYDIHARVGKLLGTALLSNSSVEHCLNCLYDLAIEARGGEIVLIFDLGATALAALPWEVTYNGLQPILLTKGVVLNCTRVIKFPHKLPSPLPLGKRLHILTIAPKFKMDENQRAFEQLARIRMRDALQGLSVDIESLPEATMEALRSRLVQEPAIDILDYFGHGTFTNEGGALQLDKPQGGGDEVVASRLAALPNLPSLIILHACHSAELDINEPLAGIATSLSAAGVRAVMAMQLTIRMTAATNAVVPTFYQKVAEGNSVQSAIAKIRQTLFTEESDGASWYLPILYLRQPANQPFILRERFVVCPPNPFAGEGASIDQARFIGRETLIRRMWDRLHTGGNLSIIGKPGSGKSTMLLLIAKELQQRMGSETNAIWLSLKPDIKRIEAERMLAQLLGGPSAKSTDLMTLIENKHLILLLDDLGELDKGLTFRLNGSSRTLL